MEHGWMSNQTRAPSGVPWRSMTTAPLTGSDIVIKYVGLDRADRFWVGTYEGGPRRLARAKGGGFWDLVGTDRKNTWCYANEWVEAESHDNTYVKSEIRQDIPLGYAKTTVTAGNTGTISIPAGMSSGTISVSYDGTETTLTHTTKEHSVNTHIATVQVIDGTVSQLIDTTTGKIVWQSEAFQEKKDADGKLVASAIDLAREAAETKRDAVLAKIWK